MKEVKLKTVLSLLILPLFLWADSNLYFSSPNLCARQSAKPAKSVYLYVDGFGPGRSATKWARDAQLEKVELVKSTWQKLHARSFYLSKRVMELMLSKELPLISNEIFQSCGDSLNCPAFKKLVDTVKDKIISVYKSTSVQCTWVKKALPILTSAKAPSKTDLEDLAVAYLDGTNYIDSCEKIFSGETKNTTDLVLKWDLNPDPQWWEQNGFSFWHSYKVYMSLFWGMKWNHPALKDQEIVRSFSVDEVLTVMADGCYSISKPECNSDFLNISQLKSTIKKGGFQNSFLMANEILKTQVNSLGDRLNPPAQAMSENTNTRSELLSLMKMRHQSNFELYKAIRNLGFILNQKPASVMYSELMPLMNANSINPELYTVCAEVNKIVDTKLSPFALELSISKGKISSLSQGNVLGQYSEPLFIKGVAFLETLKPLCKQVEDRLKQKMISGDVKDFDGMIPARKWFQIITQYNLPENIVNSNSVENGKIESPLDGYVQAKGEVICSSAIECTREVMENIVHLYQAALYRNVTSSKILNEVSADRHLGGDVACGLYDPWEKSQLRKRNLVSDLVSSVVSGVAMLPIYLDLDFESKSLVSFEQLYENGKIKFDPQYADQSTKTTLFLDLGQLAKAPCYISVSNSSKIKSPNSALLFQGISFQGCIQNSQGQIVSDTLNMKSNQLREVSACGACMLNFEEVAVATVTNNYNLFRFGIRFVAALVTYFKDQENPINQPIELTVNPEFLKETYLKYNSIPDSCVYELVNGSRCMENLCLSYTMAQVEKSWGVKVNDGSVWNSQIDHGSSVNVNYTDAWLKIDGCEREVRIPITCQQGKKPSFVNIPKKAPSCVRSRK